MKLKGASHLHGCGIPLTLSKLLQTSKVVHKHLAVLWTLFSETFDPSTAIAVLHALLKCSMRKSAGTFFSLPAGIVKSGPHQFKCKSWDKPYTCRCRFNSLKAYLVRPSSRKISSRYFQMRYHLPPWVHHQMQKWMFRWSFRVSPNANESGRPSHDL